MNVIIKKSESIIIILSDFWRFVHSSKIFSSRSLFLISYRVEESIFLINSSKICGVQRHKSVLRSFQSRLQNTFVRLFQSRLLNNSIRSPQPSLINNSVRSPQSSLLNNFIRLSQPSLLNNFVRSTLGVRSN